VSAAADWRAATRIAAPRYDAAALTAWFARVDPTPLIRRGLPMIPAPAWDRGALSTLFGLDNANHCFHVAPHTWAKFHEPQITGGFVHFLNAGDHKQRLARAIAFVKAAATCAGKCPVDIDKFSATSARCVSEENRTDILVELHRGEQRIGASVEAKFGHALTTGQLRKALLHARKSGWAMDRSVLLVVAPRPPGTGGLLGKNKSWRGTSWLALMDELERSMRDMGCDDDEFRRFRRTVWHRAY
jgi:hypothetical protein